MNDAPSSTLLDSSTQPTSTPSATSSPPAFRTSFRTSLRTSFTPLDHAEWLPAERTPSLPSEPTTLFDDAIGRAVAALRTAQRDDGHWVFELEADATIPAEYVLLTHHLGETPDLAREASIAAYLRRTQAEHGGWPLVHGGPLDVSASVKAYFALKMIGDDPDLPHMQRARQAILQAGGLAACNVFTRILLAQYRVLAWRAVPVMPVEVMLLPRWFPFHLSKVSYWARTVITPLLVLQTLRTHARNPRGVRLDELFTESPTLTGLLPRAPHQSRGWYAFFKGVDACLRAVTPCLPGAQRRRAIDAAVAFTRERLNGEDGLGAIYPAMANAVMMFDALGVPADDPARAQARDALDRLIIERAGESYVQPCVSPVWDTALCAHALLETGEPGAIDAARRGLDWLVPRQVLDVVGDWQVRRPGVRPGGWAFQYANPHYPDVDDTAVVALAMDRLDRVRYDYAVERASEWVIGMQSSDGGWGAFEPENTQLYLNNIPFSDHGAMLDPPTVDVSARCLSMLCQVHGHRPATPRQAASRERALQYVLKEQEDDGSWYGRWGFNYVYGTWSALSGLNAAGLEPAHSAMRRGAAWLVAVQNADGGWGEDDRSYRIDYDGFIAAPSTASQTAWAVLGLIAAGELMHPATHRGIAWLLHHQQADGLWHEEAFTGTGFPRVFYLRYHGYAKFFPLWALARYRHLRRLGVNRVAHGI
ncbi:squalene--hopene cyclase [Chitinasiproducens palmae]|uniref:Squalene-hopene/tetraprenyl-beta-curcumene cyclase n=1 Tax=Chitinasiproducens palmae TaxID=1770053 RepID=A0A1H2PSG6_9BURK|nr:squalene--hopene cyclase [Chitinasiproducens palmae]SDV49906.1 squalene-hopene/tetraprenyl-beta-curcumene cyclase [Chitinasiproducens palmae]